jgi:hypothetical protein
MEVFRGLPETTMSRMSKVALGINLKLRCHHRRTASVVWRSPDSALSPKK